MLYTCSRLNGSLHLLTGLKSFCGTEALCIVWWHHANLLAINQAGLETRDVRVVASIHPSAQAFHRHACLQHGGSRRCGKLSCCSLDLASAYLAFEDTSGDISSSIAAPMHDHAVE